MRTVDEVIQRLKNTHRCTELPMPKYTGKTVDDRPRIALGVASMQHHTTDEGWLLTEGLRHAGYQVFGAGYQAPYNLADVARTLVQVDPAVVFMNDIREWGEHCGVKDFRDPKDRFFRIELLGAREDIWKVGVSKDSHNSVELCNHSFRQIGAHAFQHTYHPRIVKHVNPGLRSQHLIRSWHCVNADVVPAFNTMRNGCILSGAISPVYPLRDRIAKARLPNVTHFGHPGYQRQRCHTPELLKAMSKYKVSIVTSSIFGYSLRKFAESTAAGCSVLTDLPVDEVIPEIDGNFVRVKSDVPLAELRNILAEMQRNWDAEKQRHFAEKCIAFYDWRAVGLRLAADIEAMRLRSIA